MMLNVGKGMGSTYQTCLSSGKKLYRKQYEHSHNLTLAVTFG